VWTTSTTVWASQARIHPSSTLNIVPPVCMRLLAAPGYTEEVGAGEGRTVLRQLPTWAVDIQLASP
jgi:hypothetical protein